jgi:hypothetical protein
VRAAGETILPMPRRCRVSPLMGLSALADDANFMSGRAEPDWATPSAASGAQRGCTGFAGRALAFNGEPWYHKIVREQTPTRRAS